MTEGFRVVIPSDRERMAEASAMSVLGAHPKMDAKDILIVSHRISPGSSALAPFTLIRDPSAAFSFARRANLGIRAAAPKDVVLMGDDVSVVTPDAFVAMAREAPFRVLAAGVRGRVGPWWQKEGESHPEVPFVSFICVYIPGTVIDVVGGLDEGIEGYGYEDTDYCVRVRRSGLSVGVCGAATVEHTAPSAFLEAHGGELPALERRGKASFVGKMRRG